MFKFFTKTKKKLITHDGSFHTDDVFACATLTILFEKEGTAFEITRTRNEEIMKAGDFVFDVGGAHDPEQNRFDHHQPGGAGKHDNGIEYAAFGLVWKKYGLALCGNQKAADLVDKRLVSPIDAGDNGISLFDLKGETMPYLIQHAFNSFTPGWKDASEEKLLEGFLQCVGIAKKILRNEIVRAQDVIEAEENIYAIYQNTEDKKIIVIDKKYPWYDQIQSYPEPLFVVYPRLDGSWGAQGVSADKFSIEKRKDFPASWAGLRDEELQKISGVLDATFCHRALFMAVAKSKEGAIELAQKALQN